MRGRTVGILLAGLSALAMASAQSMLEGAAAAAGGSVGGVAGKKVSDGLTKILGNVDKQTAKAADQGKNGKAATPNSVKSSEPSGPLFEVGPGTVKPDGSNVPPPPPVRRASIRKPAPPPEPVPVILPPPPVAPPPAATSDDLKALAAGASREDVLKLGAPSSRISMGDGGHLLEIYRYQSKESTIGVVRLTDGAVSSVQVP